MRPNAFTEFLRYVSRTVTGSQALVLAFTASPTSTFSHGLSTSSHIFDLHSRIFDRIRGHAFSGIENIDEFPRLKAWKEKIEARPTVEAGLAIPKTQ